MITNQWTWVYSIAVVVAVNVALQMNPTTVAQAGSRIAEKTAASNIVRHVDTPKKLVALTFDDGPSETFTPQVLELLAKYHAKATFFVIGYRAKQYPQLLARELADHHEIGNHTYSHVILTHKSEGRIRKELLDGHNAIMESVGADESHYFRPPRGRFDKKVLQLARNEGYKIILWSVDSGDWSNPGATKVARHVLAKVHSGDIVLFHDQGGNRTQTIDALNQVIPALERQGYHFVTLSELMKSTEVQK